MSDNPAQPEPRWLKVWLQGGPVGDWHYLTLIEPPDRITVMRDPFRDDWIRVIGDWSGAVAYVRVPVVEQLDHERIYYPAEAGE